MSWHSSIRYCTQVINEVDVAARTRQTVVWKGPSNGQEAHEYIRPYPSNAGPCAKYDTSVQACHVTLFITTPMLMMNSNSLFDRTREAQGGDLVNSSISREMTDAANHLADAM